MIDLAKSEKYVRLEALGMGPYMMKKLKVCPECGRLVGKRSFLCPICKKRLPTKTLFDLYRKLHSQCSQCKTSLTADAQYCPHCGKKVVFHPNEQMTD